MESSVVEILNELGKRRVRVSAYNCECCGQGYDLEPDEYGDLVRWVDVKALLEAIDKSE